MVVDFSNLNFAKERPVLVLKNLSGTPIQTLGYALHVALQLSYNEVSTLTFDLPAFVDGNPTPHYDDVVGMRIADLRGIGQFILIDPKETDDGAKKMKSCKGYSLEYEFAKKDIYLEAAVFNFCDIGHSEDTIIGRLEQAMPDWTFNVPASLMGVYRNIDETSTKVYDFMKSTVQQSYSCVFEFNTYNRTVNVVDVRDSVPTKQVYLSKECLIKEIQVAEDSDSIITCLDVNGAEGVNIRSVDPAGTNKIYNLDYFMNEVNFPAETGVMEAWQAWQTAYEAARQPFYDLMMTYNLKTMERITEETRLTEMNNAMLILQNERAVIIEGIQQGLGQTQSDLDNVNARIAAEQAKLDAQQATIDALKLDEEAYLETLRSITQSLSFENESNFTPDQYALLRKYFIEDSLEDSSFAVSMVRSFENKDVSAPLRSNSSVAVGETEATITRKINETLIAMKGGELSLTVNGIPIAGKIVRANLSAPTASDGKLVFTAYMENGSIGDAEFHGANISLIGPFQSLAPTGSSTEANSVSFTLLTDGQIYFTQDATIYQQHAIEWELLEYGRQILAEKASPTYNFTVSSVDFLSLEDFAAFARELTLGQKVYLNIGTPGQPHVLQPYVLSVRGDYDSPDSFTITFSSSYTAFDSSFALEKLLDQSISMGKTLNRKSGYYAEFIKSGASNVVKQYMDSALDIARNAVLSSGAQALSFNDAGIQLRKYRTNPSTGEPDPELGYEPEQIWMVNNMIAFTKDNWTTANMAIGKVFDPNINNYVKTEDSTRQTGKTYYYYDQTDESYKLWTSESGIAWNKDSIYELSHVDYGIVAPYLVGTILAGQNLIIDTQNGSFKVDENGVHIDSMKFYITHGDASQNTLDEELSGIDEALNGLSSDISTVEENFADAIEQAVGDVRQEIVTTYYQDAQPTGTQDHPLNTGDLWYDTDDGKLYRYNGTSWQIIEDAGITAAIQAAQNAQTTADGKIMTYYQNTPPSPELVTLDDGDLWFNTAAEDYSGTYRKRIAVGDNLSSKKLILLNQSVADFTASADVVIGAGNRHLAQLVSGTTKTFGYGAGTSHQVESDTTFWQNGTWSATEYTTVSTFGTVISVDKTSPFYPLVLVEAAGEFTHGRLYRYSREIEAWQPIKDSAIDEITTRFSTAIDQLNADLSAVEKEIVTTYYQAADPATSWTAADKVNNRGDLWFDTDDGKLYRYNGSGWDAIEDSDITAAIAAAQSAQTTADGKINTYYQATDPSAGWTSEQKNNNVGDLWYNTSTTTVAGCEPKKMYRWSQTDTNTYAWVKLEDGSIATLQTTVNNHTQTLSNVITQNGALDASALEGYINAGTSAMKSTNGNVLFDGMGMWLLNSSSMSSATKAIWMNENGIRLGGGTKSLSAYNSAHGTSYTSIADIPTTGTDAWRWTTAINHDGIAAEAIAAGTLSGMHIVGGDLQIGQISGSNPAAYNFAVDSAGNVTAKNGDFGGVIRASNIYLNGTNLDNTLDNLYNGIYRSTGQGGSGSSGGSAYYIYNGNSLKGWLSYDGNGAGDSSEARERVFLHSENALKLDAGSSISISAGTGGSVYIRGNISLLDSYGTAAPSGTGTTGQVYFQIQS